jgi:radical SAM superfamily enzyme YgiQ (UPF0313 family)
MKILLITHGKDTVSYGLVEIYYYLRGKGYNVEIINLNYRSIDEIKYTPDYVGITSMTKEFYDTISIARDVKNRWGKCKVLLGGKHFSYGGFSEDEDWYDCADHIVTGDGEYAIEKIINGEIKDKIVIGDSLTVDDYKSIPLPDKNMIINNMRNIFAGDCVRALFSRGCPYKCVYCESSSSRKKVISKEPDVAVRHIKDLVNWFGKEYVFIYDDVFTTYKNWIRDFRDEWKKQNVKAKIRCFIHGKKFDDEILDILLSMNVDKVSLGTESGDNNVLKAINKIAAVEDYFKIADLIRRKAPALKFQCLWMLGNITETGETMQKTIELSRKLGNDSPWFSYAIPFPGTNFWNNANKYGKIINNDFSTWVNTTLVFVPNGTTEKEMRYFYRMTGRV